MKIIDTVDNIISGDWGSEQPTSIECNLIHCLRSADIKPIYQQGVTEIITRYVCDKSLENKELIEGDIVIEKSGGTNECSTGRPIYISKELLEINSPLLCSNFCCAIRIKKEHNPLFVYYYLRLVHKSGIFLNFEGKTSGIHNLQLNEAFSAIDFPNYDYDEQCEIANKLSIIEQKIRLNQKQNALLEKVAKELYDYWFVQFDFPDEEGKPYRSSGGKMVWNEELKREVPEGWSVKSVFEATDVLYGYPFSTELFIEEETSIPVIRIRDILNGTTSAFSSENVDKKYRINKGDVIIGMDGNFHINIWHSDKDYLNQRCVRIRQNKGAVSAFQIYHSILPSLHLKQKTIQGSTVGHLLDKDIHDFKIIIPNDEKYAKIFDSLMSKVIANRNEIVKLTNLRDFLLPMLMNGQVGIRG